MYGINATGAHEAMVAVFINSTSLHNRRISEPDSCDFSVLSDQVERFFGALFDNNSEFTSFFANDGSENLKSELAAGQKSQSTKPKALTVTADSIMTRSRAVA
jgi:hypothetical protein